MLTTLDVALSARLSVATACKALMPTIGSSQANRYGATLASPNRRPSAKNSTLLIEPSGSEAVACKMMALVLTPKVDPEVGWVKLTVGGAFEEATVSTASVLLARPYGFVTTTEYPPAWLTWTSFSTKTSPVAPASGSFSLKYHW